LQSNLEALYDGGNPFETSETGPAAPVEVEKEDFPDSYPTAANEGIDLDAERL
jgi:hypothetical protein